MGHRSSRLKKVKQKGIATPIAQNICVLHWFCTQNNLKMSPYHDLCWKKALFDLQPIHALEHISRWKTNIYNQNKTQKQLHVTSIEQWYSCNWFWEHATSKHKARWQRCALHSLTRVEQNRHNLVTTNPNLHPQHIPQRLPIASYHSNTTLEWIWKQSGVYIPLPVPPNGSKS
jgi:hypothetical protein